MTIQGAMKALKKTVKHSDGKRFDNLMHDTTERQQVSHVYVRSDKATPAVPYTMVRYHLLATTSAATFTASVAVTSAANAAASHAAPPCVLHQLALITIHTKAQSTASITLVPK